MPDDYPCPDRLHVSDAAVRFIVGCFPDDYVEAAIPAEVARRLRSVVSVR
jgi:hypothetical protein